jgi:histidinol-phosphate/aromatic aminotransferase/cobyric acid decarboxylase-like protein
MRPSSVSGPHGRAQGSHRDADANFDIAPATRTASCACFHGGAFFEAIGDDFATLEKRHGIVNADVLDAWFPPAPRVLGALREHLSWFARTSPPTNCDGMLRAIARARGVAMDCLVAGGGSSDLIFLALRQWLTPQSRVLLLDPTYGEYSHVLEHVVGCRVDRLTLSRDNDYAWFPGAKTSAAARRAALDSYDLIILVNPNSPTGRCVPRDELAAWLREVVPPRTRVWIDEAYVDYTGAPETSLERLAATSENVVVCKSMSKAYALSGLRAAYLCGPVRLMAEVRAITPPWAVSLPAQVAAVHALGEPEYYAARYAETHALRDELATALTATGRVSVVSGAVANFLLIHLSEDGPDARTVVARCRGQGVWLRDATIMGSSLGRHAVRIAVKPRAEQARIVAALSRAIA